jgi:hypothetical protein
MTMNDMNEKEFEQLLKTTLTPRADAGRDDQAAANRVLKRLSGPLPRQQTAWWRLPAVLLDFEFDPAWPRVAALATCAALGFLIGMVGWDRQVDTADAALAYVSRADLGGIVFEADPSPGTRPGERP